MQKTDVSLEAFVQFALLPENADKDFELIDGEIIEMAPGRTWNLVLGTARAQ